MIVWSVWLPQLCSSLIKVLWKTIWQCVPDYVPCLLRLPPFSRLYIISIKTSGKCTCNIPYSLVSTLRCVRSWALYRYFTSCIASQCCLRSHKRHSTSFSLDILQWVTHHCWPALLPFTYSQCLSWKAGNQCLQTLFLNCLIAPYLSFETFSCSDGQPSIVYELACRCRNPPTAARSAFCWRKATFPSSLSFSKGVTEKTNVNTWRSWDNAVLLALTVTAANCGKTSVCRCDSLCGQSE